MGDAQRSIQKYYAPALGAFSIAPERRKMKLKKKTLYNILMIAAIAVIAALAVFFAGRHLGWFDKPVPEGETTAITATVRKGLSNLTRSGIASELTGETQLRKGDTVSVASGYVFAKVGGCSLTLSQGAKLEILSAQPEDLQVRLVTGEAFCQASDAAVTLHYGAHSAKLRSAVLVCTVRTGSETLYVLGGSVSDGTNTFDAGKTGSYVGTELSVQNLDLKALSSFALECILGSQEEMVCHADEVKSVLDSRNVTPEPIKPEADKSTGTTGGQDSTGTTKPGTPSKSDGSTAVDNTTKPDNSTKPDETTKPDDSPKPAEKPTYTCTIEIRCDTILSNMQDLKPGLDVYVPDSGTILPTTTVTFTEGETVFDVLKRICDERSIQIEYSYTPMYGSYYIEGINHLYEFDCGQQSGWMYKVNGWFPNYGCSRYQVEDGDVICWVYTCDLGADVGDNSMSG